MTAEPLLAVPFVAWLILLPLTAAALAFLCQRLQTLMVLAVAAGVPLMVAGLCWQVSLEGPRRHAVGGWDAAIGPDLYADGLTVLMLAMTAVVATSSSLYALKYFSHAALKGTDTAPQVHRRDTFWPLWLILWTALNALFLSADIFNIYVTLELLSLAAVALVASSGGAAALAAALRYLLVSLFGSLSYLLGVALLYSAFASLDLALLSQVMTSGPVAWVSLALMTAGLLMKTALFPLHFWLPAAHANAPTPVSAVLSALVVKASFYLLLRLWFTAYPPGVPWATGQILGALGAGAIIWGSIQALRQERLKLLVAYSTVAQLGYLFLVFPLGRGAASFTAWSGVTLFAVAHACGKAAMFLSAGSIAHAVGHDRFAEMEGSGQGLVLPLLTFALAAISIIGLPPSGGFMAKWMLLNAALTSGQWWWVPVMAAGSLLASVYVLRVVERAFLSSAADGPRRPIPSLMKWSALSLALAALFLGLFSGPQLDLLRVGAPLEERVLTEVDR